MRKKLIALFIMFIIISSNVSIAEGLSLSGESYILIDAESGRILIEKDSNKRMPMASTTKIMTALIAVEEGNLKDKVVIDDKSTNIEGSSIYLEKDEVLTLKDLIYGLMLRSGNDSSVAIANHISKSEDEFIEKMNSRARKLGANNTNFKNPHGLDDKDHYSTAYDLALITKEALKHKEFKEIFKTKTYTSSREKNEYFINKNKTLWDYEGGNGGKTGYTMSSGRCLVSTAEREGMQLIAVSLNAYNWFEDNYKLMDYGFEKFDSYVIYDKNQLIKSINIDNIHTPVYALTKNEFVFPLLDEEKNSIKVKLDIYKDLKTPIEKSQKIGVIETYLEGVLIKEEDILSKNKIKKQSMVEKLFKNK